MYGGSATHFLYHSLYRCRPVKLIEIVKNRFLSLGGIILEGYSMSSICIFEDAAVSFYNFQIVILVP